MATVRTPRGSWIAEGLRALRDGGVEAVRIELLAQALGVTRGGFYWHFSGRQALLEDMLDAWERDVTTALIEKVEAGGGDARTRLRRLFSLAASGDGLLTDLRTDSAVRDWARRDPAVAERLWRVDNRRMDYLRRLFGGFCADPDEVEVRCTLCFTVWIGNRLLTVDHGGRSAAEVMGLIQERLLR
ncbi:TetR/AcrR family transcriptional regulator [Streptomyces sp. CC224B]|uniref:TetR/AcrR family transcriptional regulator n=1 Tax=Streptomyces sp. CC224B TaxID=3044571 RepID=UPI0024A8276D|nr:TetR/AcrR family transcriptional regulator [Streptomyces sp. CC224B]